MEKEIIFLQPFGHPVKEMLIILADIVACIQNMHRQNQTHLDRKLAFSNIKKCKSLRQET